MQAQSSSCSAISIDPQLKDSFSFTKKWDYAWDIIKDDDGKLFRADGEKIKPADTAHLFFTANCHTNVQGGYNIRYCYASKKDDNIQLLFSDGLPAYASDFLVYIKKDSACFKPKTIYPAPARSEKITYRIDKGKLVLNTPAGTAKNIMGYIDLAFTEIVTLPGKEPQETQLYLKGYFKTPLKEAKGKN